MLQRVILNIMGFTRGPYTVSSGWFIKRGGKLFQLKESSPTGEILDTEANGDIIWSLLGQSKSHHVKTQSGFSTL